MNKWVAIILVSWFLPHHSFKKEMVNRNGAGRGFPIGVWCHSWVLCWIFAGWRWHLTNSMCRMERRQSMVTPGAKPIHQRKNFSFRISASSCDKTPIGHPKKTEQKVNTHSLSGVSWFFVYWNTIDITSAALKKSSVLWKIDSPWAMDPPTSGSKALALHFSKDLGSSETQNLSNRRTGTPTVCHVLFVVWK